MRVTWSKSGGYECSTKGDKRFSAMCARMPDGRTIEQWYQCDVKMYQPGGTDWRLGKGKPPRFLFPEDQLWEMYLSLWRLWACHNVELIKELNQKAKEHNNVLSDCFASSKINQARALSTILSEWCS